MDRALLQLNIALENPHMNHYDEVASFLGELFHPVLRSLALVSYNRTTFYWHLSLEYPNQWDDDTIPFTIVALNH